MANQKLTHTIEWEQIGGNYRIIKLTGSKRQPTLDEAREYLREHHLPEEIWCCGFYNNQEASDGYFDEYEINKGLKFADGKWNFKESLFGATRPKLKQQSTIPLILCRDSSLMTCKDGNISHTQTFFGMDEVCEVYDHSNAESDEELENGGKELIEKSWNSDSVKINFTNASSVYDIGDIVGAKENVTGISIVQKIIKKIVTLNNDRATISYKVGE